MKKLIKYIFVFIMGGLVFGTLGIFAYTYTANDIVYTPSNNSWKVNNMKDAIDSIKNTNDTTIANLQSSNNSKDETIASLTNQINSLSEYDKCIVGKTTLNNSALTNEGQLVSNKVVPTKLFLMWAGNYVCGFTGEQASLHCNYSDTNVAQTPPKTQYIRITSDSFYFHNWWNLNDPVIDWVACE